MRLRSSIAVGCAALLLALPANALAVATIAPPGKSGADQYFETIPSARGNVAPPNGTGGGVSASGAFGAGERALGRLGPDGRAAAALNAADAPSRPAVPGALSPKPNGSVTSAIGNLIGGSDTGGLGVALPIALATGLLVAIALLAARLRRRNAAV